MGRLLEVLESCLWCGEAGGGVEMLVGEQGSYWRCGMAGGGMKRLVEVLVGW